MITSVPGQHLLDARLHLRRIGALVDSDIDCVELVDGASDLLRRRHVQAASGGADEAIASPRPTRAVIS